MPTQLISIIKIALAVITYVFSASFTYELPLGEMVVPITGQSLAIVCWAFFLRPAESFIAVTTYILMGVYALPVFAEGAQGMDVLTGNTGGYIIGFLLASLVVSWIRDPYKKENPFSVLVLMIVGTVIILVCGIIRLSILMSFEDSVQYGFYNLWQGAVIKILLGTVICYVIHMIFRYATPDKYKK
jgi:biotin transport system substrate-specific component